MRIVTVRGASATGKSRLVEWFARRADEVGAIDLLRADHDVIPGPRDGVTGAIERQLRCQHLDRGALFDRTLDILERFDADTDEDARRLDAAALTELLRPSSGEGADAAREHAPVVSFESQRERHNVIEHYLRRAAARRPVLLWIEDVQWGDESLALVRHLMRRREDTSPMLVILTARVEALTERPREASRLAEIERDAITSTLHLEPLTRREHADFVSRLVALEPALARDVAARTARDPLFATQLVGDWIARDLLEAGPRGFALRERVALPADVYDLWSSRLERLDAIGFVGWREPLELAAALGMHFEHTVWREACHRAGYNAPLALLPWLTSRGLLRRLDQQKTALSWRHAMLRESVARSSRHAGRWSSHHRVLAAMLADHPRAEAPDLLERRARHLLEAGDLDRALELLRCSVAGRATQRSYDQALALVALHEETADALGLSARDPRRAQLWPIEANLLRYTGAVARAIARCEEALEDIEALEDPRKLRADLLRVLTLLRWQAGDLAGAACAGEEALALYGELGDDEGRLRTLHSYGWAVLQQCRFEDALYLFTRGAKLGRELRSDIDRAWCVIAISDVHIRRNQPDEAEPHAHTARALFDRAGARSGVATTLHMYGMIARARGDLDEAERRYDQAAEIWDYLGSALVQLAHIDRALVATLRQDWAATRRRLERFDASRGAHYQLEMSRDLLWMAVHGAEGDLDAWDAAYEHALRLMQRTPTGHPDLLLALRPSIASMRQRGDAARLERALEFARWVAQALGDARALRELDGATTSS